MASFQKTDVALVTGAGSGIGRATCLALASQGATVVAADINKQSADETVAALAGDGHLGVQLDVTIEDDVRKVVSDIIPRHYSSPATICVNSAGVILDCSGALCDLEETAFDKVFSVNVKGTVLVTKAICRELVSSNKPGAIVNISSGERIGIPYNSIYDASKGAIDVFSVAIAREFGRRHIRVNVVAPGLTSTPMVMNSLSEDSIKSIIEMVSLGRIAKPEEIAEVICFLVSKKSSYMTGACVPVDGGFPNFSSLR